LIGDDNWDDDFASSISPSALHLPQFRPYDNFGGMLSSDRLKAFASFDLATDENDNWDNNFEGDLVTIKGPLEHVEPDTHELETIRPYRVKPTIITQDLKPAVAPKLVGRKASTSAPPRPKSPIKAHTEAKFVLPSRPSAMYREQSVEDYSDLFVDNDSVFDKRLNIIKDDALSPKLFHPSDLTRSAQSPTLTGLGSMRRKPAPRAEVQDQSMRRTRSSVEIQRYAEDEDDEDFSDIFGNDDVIVERDESDRGSEDGVGALMLHSKFSNGSWLGDEDDEDDPFASLEQGFDEMDLQANIARDKHARLCTLVEGLVSSLKVREEEDVLEDLSEQLVRFSHLCRVLHHTNVLQLDVLYESEEAKGLIISAHGMLPILEILEPCTVKSRQSMILRLLKVVNTVRHANIYAIK
jgi:hypothetical protein